MQFTLPILDSQRIEGNHDGNKQYCGDRFYGDWKFVSLFGIVPLLYNQSKYIPGRRTMVCWYYIWYSKIWAVWAVMLPWEEKEGAFSGNKGGSHLKFNLIFSPLGLCCSHFDEFWNVNKPWYTSLVHTFVIWPHYFSKSISKKNAFELWEGLNFVVTFKF